jgi:hypothetical protein
LAEKAVSEIYVFEYTADLACSAYHKK